MDADTHFDPCVPGGWRLGIRYFHCWNEGHGSLGLVGAMEQSCDVFFYQVGIRTGLSELHRAASSFGFGMRTGLALPGEAAGTVPDAQYYDRTIGAGEWIEEGQVINLAIGQGEILATPLQVAVMTSAIANGGLLVTPYLVDYTFTGGSGTRHLLPRPRPEMIENLSMEDLDLVREGMIQVVNGENGTARHVALSVPEARVAGKTGTGQNPHGENHAWFTAFAPVDDPEIVVTVLVENGGGGSAVAAPIAARVLSAYFRNRSGGDRSALPPSGMPR
jgi:penicillin-binding protein 2